MINNKNNKREGSLCIMQDSIYYINDITKMLPLIHKHHYQKNQFLFDVTLLCQFYHSAN